MKAIVLIPEGVGIRNFVFSSFLDLLSEEAEVAIWHGFSADATGSLQGNLGSRVRWLELPRFREGIPERILRRAKIYAQLYWQAEPGLELILNMLQPRGRWLDVATGYAARLAGRLGSSARGAERLDRCHAWFTLQAAYLERFVNTLEAERPDFVFCTHQRSSAAVPAMLAARRLGIPTATFIYSWDNLPKGRMAVHADHFLVWSEFMAQELGRYYPEVSADRVHVVGTPQFESYFEKSLLESRAEFFSHLGLDPDKLVVCFSGCDLTTSPYDPLYLRDVAEALRQSPKAERPQLLFRPSPTDDLGRFSAVLTRYPEVVVSKPLWTGGKERDWTQTVPAREDVALLVNIATHCDLVVNCGSTMAVDFAIHDRPAVFLAYNPAGGENDPTWKAEDLYRLPHFRLIDELQPVYWARSAQEVPGLVHRILGDPAEKAGERRELLRRIAAQPFHEASFRCCQALLQIAGKPAELCTSAF